MSPVGPALQDRFESVCRSELHRLRRKTASLTAADRTQIDALALEVAHGLACHLDAAIEASEGAGLAATVMRLFAAGPRSLEEQT